MLHPFTKDLSSLSDKQLDETLSDLTKKYFLTRNPEAKEGKIDINAATQVASGCCAMFKKN